ncbi:fasciclin domain-containing protein [Cesiribacter sp. SM1]|uniref:fasciclin domain-containing protein n=1 Tax=Cesiribacter sp. SM1 TaxID=2861196 RepID=UPI001CD7FB85|nr:fasciclin domain-containing protein [Cesiribacter sp. SM1]
MNFLKPIAMLAVIAVTAFGCAGTNEATDQSTATNDPMATGTTTGTTNDPMVNDGTTTTGTTGTTGTYGTTGTTGTTTDPMNNGTATGTGLETQQMANDAVDYADMFEDVDNTEQYDILALARMNPNLSTFVQLVESANLTPSIQAAGPITVFIPTNEAFGNLSAERYAELTDPQNRTELIEVLNRHVMAQEVTTASFTGRQVIDLANGEQIPVTTSTVGAGVGAAANPTGVTIGGAQIVKADVEASNGVIHVVDAVIETEDITGPGMQR